MKFFNIQNLINSFNKLQSQVDAYLEAQREEVNRLEKLVEDAKSDARIAQGLQSALKSISNGE